MGHGLGALDATSRDSGLGMPLAKPSCMPRHFDRPFHESRVHRPAMLLVPRLIVAVSLLALIFGALRAGAIVEEGPLLRESWRQLQSIGGRGALPSALAQTEAGDVAVADEAGVSWWQDGSLERAVMPPVRDLDFDARGVLWIATLDGLYAWERAGRPTTRRLRGGEAANRIHRIAVSATSMLVATGAGAYWSSDGSIFQPLRASGAATSTSLVAIRSAEFDRSRNGSGTDKRVGRAEAWLYGGGRLSVVRGFEASSGLRVLDVRQLSLPRPGGESEPVDLVVDPWGERLYFVFPDLIAWRPLGVEAETSAGAGWTLERPDLPPGSRIRRLGWAADRVWITTDHGLLASDALGGPFHRAASPVGTTECVELRAREPNGAIALCRSGLFVLEPLVGGAALASSRLPEILLPPDPPLEEIRRRALLRAGLTASRSHDLWARLRRRAYWPEVGLSFDADFDSDDQTDRDESFLSGEVRRLRDRTRDEGHSYQAGIELDWDLGGVVYPLDSVDLSRELRQVVSLRDDVADEINQLYFERQAIREQLGRQGSVPPADAARLRWRASELDAGLDAWTGGWITQWRGRQAGSPARIERPDLHPERSH